MHKTPQTSDFAPTGHPTAATIDGVTYPRGIPKSMRRALNRPSTMEVAPPAPRHLYRFYVSDGDDCETDTLAIVYAENDETAFTAGENVAGEDAMRAMSAHYGVLDGRSGDGPSEDEDHEAFFSVECLEDEGRLAHALADLHPRYGVIAAVRLATMCTNVGKTAPLTPSIIAKRADAIAARFFATKEG